ncbi:MAG: RluA family pseudouridine synthase [Kiritimatiellae bacterium]|nr:RluA family pseudouridine synthase [Kiritimatiellia bacterium]
MVRGLEILAEDEDFVVVNKPAKIYTHPSPGHESGTLSDLLVAKYPEMREVGSAERPGVVHRLDYGTSGAIVFARNRKSYLKLREAFESHAKVTKTYLAVLHGAPGKKSGRLDFLVGKKPWDPKRMAIVPEGGKKAITYWEILSKNGSLALVEFRITTGRTHQIRLAAAHLGHPIVGDELYGDRKADLRLKHPQDHTLLHAVKLEFPHPRNGRIVSFCAQPPPEIIWAM